MSPADPSPQELAAIVAAVELCWPRPAGGGGTVSTSSQSPTWRFSGRWWAQPTALRRERPWAAGRPR